MQLRDIEPERGIGRARDFIWLACLLLALGVAWGTSQAQSQAVEARVDRLETRIMHRLNSIEAEVRNRNGPNW